MRQTRAGRRRERDRGASLVEFALIIPLLTVFLFGIVQFGIAYDKQQSINSAAREGARIGALRSTSLADIATRAREAYGASAAAGEEFSVVVNNEAPTAFGTYDRAANGSETYSVTSGDPESDPTAMPCGADPASAFVQVVVSTPYDITIPFFGVQSITIDSQAEFRCERAS